MMKRLLLTGGSGFVGGFIQEELAKSANQGRYQLFSPAFTEIRDPAALSRLIEEVQPDQVIHLAAQSFIPQAFADPMETCEINFFGTLNLLNTLKQNNFKGKFLFIGSGDMYGLVDPESLPVTERCQLKPRNPYAVSKVAAEALCYQWSQMEEIDIVMARPFNHIGPRQSERFVISDFARQLIEIKHDKREAEILVGDIDVTRDFTDVRDVVKAYLLLLDAENGEIYNVCSEREQSIRHMLQQLMAISGVRANIKQDSARLRPVEQRRIYGSCAKLREATGWQPEIALEKSLADILNYWEGGYHA